MPPTLCTVSGVAVDSGNNPVAVTVSVRPATTDRTTLEEKEQMLDRAVSTTSSGVDGTWSLDVVPSEYAGGRKYQFTVDDHEGPAVTVPSQASADLADLEGA